jgi:hypothetical protein
MVTGLVVLEEQVGLRPLHKLVQVVNQGLMVKEAERGAAALSLLSVTVSPPEQSCTIQVLGF